MGRLEVVGVRHHSPACARLVRRRIAESRPAWVLIEGPMDLNDRLGELLLGHELPIAAYAYRLLPDGRRATGSWSPFCAHSPEWVALTEGVAAGANVRFVDLPSWHPALADRPNRYADHHLRTSHRLPAIADQLGFSGVDPLWDHLFECRPDDPALGERLRTYFAALRADEPPAPGDDEREHTMAEFARWALAQTDRPVLLVCGGYHAPALERLCGADAPGVLAHESSLDPASEPRVEVREGQVGTYLVPYSFHRLDRFTGYASGLPSPAWYAAQFDDPEAGWERMLRVGVERVRARGLPASTADLGAARTLAEGLAHLRGNQVPSRCDVLDALVSALMKDALARPLPWQVGGLAAGTDPVVVELVAAFSGDRTGRLAAGTPQPPLVADLKAELRRVGVELGPHGVNVDVEPLVPADQDRRRALVRLAVLGIPEVRRVREASRARGGPTAERWRVRELPETDPTAIERAVYGATLAEAARGRLAEELTEATGAGAVARGLRTAVHAGFPDLATELADRLAAAIEAEAVLGEAGAALDAVADLAREGVAGALVEAVLGRTTWLLEARSGPHQPFHRPEVLAVAAIRRVLADPGDLADHTRAIAIGVLGRRAADPDAPPALRGASLGALWSVDPAAPTLARSAAGSIGEKQLGDWLSGLFVLAREPMLDSSLVAVVDARIAAMGDEPFLEALPTLRRAFGFFPPAERARIARELLRRAGKLADTTAFLSAPVDAEVPGARAFDARLADALARYHLLAGAR